jgi:hypothetical protein
MMVRRSLLALPVLILSGCVDSASITAPDGSMMDVTPMSTTWVVDNLLDDGSVGSLRHAISVAGNGHNITFAPELAGGTIVLGIEIFLNKSLTIVGPPGGITISGNKATRVFRIAEVYEVVLDNLTIRDGYAHDFPFGGAIRNLGGNLIIRNSTLEGNWAENVGGAIDQINGALTIRNSTLANNGVNVLTNSITGFGGAIRVFQGVVDIANTTISGNSAASAGGGIVNNQGALTITHGTIADNGASFGGGIANYGGFDDTPAVTTLVNTIVARNFASSSANGPDILNVFDPVELTASHSLIGTADGHNLVADENNYVGVDAQFVLDGFDKPLLADNGGTTKTHMLLPDSPAIDKADGAACAAAPVNGLDQRGVARPQGAGCDMGAVEVQGAVAPPTSVSNVTINATGTVDKDTGVAYVTGMLTCPDPGVVNLLVSVNQEQKQRRLTLDIAGSTTVSVQCDGATAWSVAVAADNGAFVNGNVQVAAATQNIAPAVEAAAQVKLFWSK